MDFFSHIMNRRWLFICLGALFLLSLMPVLSALFAGGLPDDAARASYYDIYYSAMVREAVN